MWKLKYQSNNTGFTLIETILTICVIAILGALLSINIISAKSSAEQAVCMNDLRQISQGLQMYYNDNESFPQDGYPDDANDNLPLSTELAEYVPGKSAFICPQDNDETSISNFASYDPYYVARMGSYQEDQLVIGCPRHIKAQSAVSVFRAGSTAITAIATVLANGQEIPPEGTTAERSISNTSDVMTFTDGSTVTITDTQTNYGTFLVQSIRLADGTLYSIIRVKNDGTINVEVSSGSIFEVITPSACVGVRGTRFTVKTLNLGSITVVTLIDGTVTVEDRATGGTSTLTSGGLTEITVGTVGEEQQPISEEDIALIASINQPLETWEVVDILDAEYPLSDDVLLALINRDPLIENYGNYDILKRYKVGQNPLSENVLNAMINESQLMQTWDGFRDVLVNNSPLPASIWAQVCAGTPPMENAALNDVKAVNPACP